MTIRVLLVDDQILFRRGIRALLAEQPDIEVIAEVGDGQAAIDAVETMRPDIVLMDLNMPICSGVEATRVIKEQYPETRVMILTVSDEDDELFAAIKSGASGYLLKDLEPNELFGMIRGVMRGEAPISSAVAGKLLHEFREQSWRGAVDTKEGSLTAREREVLQLVADGYSNMEIAKKLFIVEGTVKNHLHNILEKLHLENRLQAATYAIRHGLVERPRPRRNGG